MSFLFSANDLARTRLCAARDCPQDAELGQALCARCSRKASIRLHVIQQPPPYDPLTQLWCQGACQAYKPDAEYSLCAKNTYRRGRHKECRACAALRRRRQRAVDPERNRAKERAWGAAQRQRARAQREAQR